MRFRLILQLLNTIEGQGVAFGKVVLNLRSKRFIAADAFKNRCFYRLSSPFCFLLLRNNGDHAMCFPQNRYPTLLLLIGLWLGFATLSAASDFTALYQLQNVVDNGSQVSGNLVMQVSNNTAADVSNATLTVIEGPLLPVVTDMTYSALSIPAGNNVTIQGAITIPAALYSQWQNGIMPHTLIQYTDAGGNSLQFPIEVTGGL
jgi:hypothetical protein